MGQAPPLFPVGVWQKSARASHRVAPWQSPHFAILPSPHHAVVNVCRATHAKAHCLGRVGPVPCAKTPASPLGYHRHANALAGAIAHLMTQS